MGYVCKDVIADQVRSGSFGFDGPSLLISTPAPSRRFPRASDMRRMTIVAIATMLATVPAFAQSLPAGSGIAPLPVKPATAAPAVAAPSAHAAPAKPAVAASTPESRSAAAFALSHEPPYDEGPAQRVRDAAP